MVNLVLLLLPKIYTHMKVYLHGNFWFLSALVPYPCYFFKSPSEVPDDCDFVGFSCYDHSDVSNIIETLCAKSKTVFFDWNEFTREEYTITEVDLHNRHPNLQIFSSMVPNYPSRLLFSGFWFMVQKNYYEACDPRPWAAQLLDSLEYRAHRPRIIDCLLGGRRQHRDFIERHYLQLPPDKQELIYWSYYKDDITKGSWQFDVTGLDLSANNVPMKNPGRIEVDHVPASAVLPIDIYNQSWFSVVTKTVTYNSYSFFGEKIAKPMIAGRLFVCFAGQYFLKNLRRLGFRTFDGIIDESYDDIPDPIERWTRAWQQVVRLLESDPAEIHRQSLDILQHNQTHFRNTDWLSSIKARALPILLGNQT